MFAQPGHGCRRIEDDLRAVQPQRPRAFREVPIVANIHPDFDEAQIEHRIPEVPGPEIELLPETRRHVRNVRFAVLPKVSAVIVDHRGRVVIYARLLHLVNRHDDRHAMFPGQILHQLYGGPVRDTLREIVPAGSLLRAEVRPVKNLLQATDLRPGIGGLLDIGHVLVDHGRLGGFERSVRRRRIRSLDQRTPYNARHDSSGAPGNTPPTRSGDRHSSDAAYYESSRAWKQPLAA